MKPTCAARHAASSPSDEPRDVDAADADLARRRLVDAGDQVEQRRLARARRPHQRDEVAGRDVEVDVDQHRDDLVAAHVVLGQVADRDQRRRRPAPARVRRRRPRRRSSACIAPARYFAATFTSAPAASVGGGLQHDLLAALARRRRSPSRSPIFGPASTGTCDRLAVAHDEHHRAAVALRRAHRRSRRAAASAARASPPATGSDTLALISGRMRGSISSNCTLVITVAFARSTVGTMRLMRPRKRASGSASSVISHGCPTLDLGEARFGDVGLDLERAHVGHR